MEYVKALPSFAAPSGARLGPNANTSLDHGRRMPLLW
jgi:hypothetical protein